MYPVSLPSYLITVLAYIIFATAVFVLAHWVRRGVLSLLDIHRASLIFLAEHDLLAEDYCIRRNIQRHNLRAMAMAVAAANGDRRERDVPPPNGEHRKRGKGAHN